LDTTDILNRLSRLEQQNRRLKILLFVFFVAGCGWLIYKEVRTSRVIETQSLVIKDNNGKRMGEFAYNDGIIKNVGLCLYDGENRQRASLSVDKNLDKLKLYDEDYRVNFYLYGEKRDMYLSHNATNIDPYGVSISNGQFREKGSYQWTMSAHPSPHLSLWRGECPVFGVDTDEDNVGLTIQNNFSDTAHRIHMICGEYPLMSVINGKSDGCRLVGNENPYLSITQDGKDRLVLGCSELVDTKTGEKRTTIPTLTLFDKDGKVQTMQE
jgi:hypothetical protein